MRHFKIRADQRHLHKPLSHIDAGRISAMVRREASPVESRPMSHYSVLVAVPADIRTIGNHRWHASPESYLKAILRVAGATPVIVPALSSEIDIAAILSRVDGVLVTGSVTNVHPERYGATPSPAHEPYDLDRDALTDTMMRQAIEAGVPLLAICRGLQELNVARGGTLATEIQELEGRMDHRAGDHPEQAQRYAIRQPVSAVAGGILGGIVGATDFQVNSLHRQAIDRLGAGLTVEATAPDGTIEAVSVDGAKTFALGVQWHPEYWAESDPASAAIFKAFGEACRNYGRAKVAACNDSTLDRLKQDIYRTKHIAANENETEIAILIIDETYGINEETYEIRSKKYKKALQIEFDAEFDDSNVGPGADIPAFLTTIATTSIPLWAVLLGTFFLGKPIDENLEAWSQIGGKIRRFFSRPVLLSRNGAAVIAIEAILAEMDGTPLFIKLLSYRYIYFNETTKIDKIEQSRTINRAPETISLSRLQHIFEIEADGVKFRVSVLGKSANSVRI